MWDVRVLVDNKRQPENKTSISLFYAEVELLSIESANWADELNIMKEVSNSHFRLQKQMGKADSL